MAHSRSRSRFWPGMVFGLIGLNMLIVLGTIIAAHSKQAAFAVEPEYDRRALHWDDSARQLARNAELGWSIRVDQVESAGISVSLLDKAGVAIEGARISLEAFHHARAANKFFATLTPLPGGGYTGPARVDVPGLWEFRFIVKHGTETFTAAMTRAIIGDRS